VLRVITTNESGRELAHRIADGIDVTLLWHPGDDSLSLRVFDRETGELFAFPVRRDQAMVAFDHPFVYVALEQLHDDQVELRTAA